MAGFFKRRLIKSKNTLSDWLGIGIAVGVFNLMKDIFVSVFFRSKQEKGPSETFDEAVARLRLTESDLVDRRKMFLIQTLLYLVSGVCVIIYAIWLAFHAYWTGCLWRSWWRSWRFRMHFAVIFGYSN